MSRIIFTLKKLLEWTLYIKNLRRIQEYIRKKFVCPEQTHVNLISLTKNYLYDGDEDPTRTHHQEFVTEKKFENESQTYCEGNYFDWKELFWNLLFLMSHSESKLEEMFRGLSYKKLWSLRIPLLTGPEIIFWKKKIVWRVSKIELLVTLINSIPKFVKIVELPSNFRWDW